MGKLLATEKDAPLEMVYEEPQRGNSNREKDGEEEWSVDTQLVLLRKVEACKHRGVEEGSISGVSGLLHFSVCFI